MEKRGGIMTVLNNVWMPIKNKRSSLNTPKQLKINFMRMGRCPEIQFTIL